MDLEHEVIQFAIRDNKVQIEAYESRITKLQTELDSLKLERIKLRTRAATIATKLED